MGSFPRMLILAGILLIAAGALFFGLAKVGLPLGRLPGDIRIERDGFSCFIPLASGLLLSILLSLALNLINRFF